MVRFKSFLVVPMLVLGLGATQAAAYGQSQGNVQVAPPDSYVGQWYTTPDGCSYSRAKAPGYPTMWVLINNPHHIGQPNAGPHCATILGG